MTTAPTEFTAPRRPAGPGSRDWVRYAVLLGGAWLLLMLLFALLIAIAGTTLSADERALLLPIAQDRIGLAAIIAIVIVLPLGIAVPPLFKRYVVAPRQLAEASRIVLSANSAHRVAPQGSAENRQLAEVINNFAAAYQSLQQDVELRIREANTRIGEERNRLAALMSELAQSVVVCNVEGRVLLYNARAERLLRKPLANAAAGTKSHSMIGLGRSIFALFDRNLIIHGLERTQEQSRHGDAAPVASFVATAPGGQLVRVQLAPVVAPGAPVGERSEDRAITGFVLILEDITRSIGRSGRRDKLLQTLTEGTRASLANMRAAVETITSFPDMETAAQGRFLGIIRDEAGALSTRLDQTAAEYADSLKTEWPLEEMRGVDLIEAARRQIQSSLSLRTKLEEIDEAIWLKVDSYSLMQAFAYVARRLQEEFQIREIRFALADAGALAHLDLIWSGAPLGVETQMAWQSESMTAAGEAYPTTLTEIIARHDAEIWYQIDKPTFREFFRIAIPVTRPEETQLNTPLAAESRPEYYDFDLFHQPGQTPELDNRLLTELNFTVFDTETTGLSPSEGDEIVSMGAVRIVNGRLLEHEVFEQLIDPGRRMSAKATEITGIDDAMLAGQPNIAQVLPAFHQFGEDTVLVAHNAAFDMRFLQLKEAATGVRFTQPVLDTLLLSVLIHPSLEGHGLEAIGERLGVNIIGRHTALGDAIVTGQIFLRLVPLLAERGIRTLKEAREASASTYYSRIEY
jgi:DNA polymerase-3 subunit epsilon